VVAGAFEVSRVVGALVPWPVGQPDAEPPPLQIVRRDAEIALLPPIPVQRSGSLAQTFSFDERRTLSAVGLWFTAKDATAPVTIKLVRVVNGLPGSEALWARRLAPADITIGVEKKIALDRPVSSGAVALSPLLHTGALHLVGYKVATAGAYVTRMLQMVQGAASTKVYAQMNVPDGCSVIWHATNDDGAHWKELTPDTSLTRSINSVWMEYVFAGSFDDPTKKQIRYKAVMTGSGAFFPRIHRLGATLS
jgi:hypothetical protein